MCAYICTEYERIVPVVYVVGRTKLVRRREGRKERKKGRGDRERETRGGGERHENGKERRGEEAGDRDKSLSRRDVQRPMEPR